MNRFKRTIDLLGMLFLIAGSALMISCGEDIDDYGAPHINKPTFNVTGTGKTDTLYLTDGEDYRILVGSLSRKSDTNSWCDINPRVGQTELKIEGKVVGKAVYANGEIAKVEVYDWLEVTQTRDKNKRKIYIIKPLGKKTDFLLNLLVAAKYRLNIYIW